MNGEFRPTNQQQTMTRNVSIAKALAYLKLDTKY